MSRAPKRTVSAVGTNMWEYGVAGWYLKVGTVSSQDLSAKFLQRQCSKACVRAAKCCWRCCWLTLHSEELQVLLGLETDCTHYFGDIVILLTRAKDTKLLQFREKGIFLALML